MQITLGTQYNMSGRNHVKKNQNTPRPSEHPRVIKASTRMILVHVQKMYNIFRILIGVPDYSSSSFFFNEEEAVPPPPTNKILRGTHLVLLSIPRLWRKNIFRDNKSKHQNDISTCTEDVEYI